MKLKFNRFALITVLVSFLSFLLYCTYQNPIDISEDITNNGSEITGSLTKLPVSEMYISSKADLQIDFLKPGYDWKMHDLTEGRSIVSLYSTNNLLSSPAEDLLPRFTIVEMIFKKDRKGTAKKMALYREKKLKEMYGEGNVETIKMEDSNIGNFSCIHFSYKVKYPVSGKHVITDEYGFRYDSNYYMIQFSKLINDINGDIISETFSRILNNLKITKSLIL